MINKKYLEEIKELRESVEFLDNYDLRKLRDSLGLTQDKMASLIEIPLRTYCRWENKEAEPRISSLKNLFEKLYELYFK